MTCYLVQSDLAAHLISCQFLCHSAASQLHQKRDDMGFGAAGRSLLRCSQFGLLQSDLAAHLISCQTLCQSSHSLSGFLQLTVTVSFIVLLM